MVDNLTACEISESTGRVTRPSLAQVKAVVDFLQKHPGLAHRKLRYGMSREKFKTLWIELSNIANGFDGAVKSPKGWIKFWSDKRRSTFTKQKQIKEGKLNDKITPLELKILTLTSNGKQSRRKNSIKLEPCNSDDDDDSLEDIFCKDGNYEILQNDPNIPKATNPDENNTNMMEKLVDVMSQQAGAISQIAEAVLNNSKSLEKMAEASHKQALAVDRLASTFEGINASVYDVRSAIMSIDYTLKRCYSATSTHRQNLNIF